VLIAETPVITLAERVVHLKHQHGLGVAPSIVWRLLDRHGLSSKNRWPAPSARGWGGVAISSRRNQTGRGQHADAGDRRQAARRLVLPRQSDELAIQGRLNRGSNYCPGDPAPAAARLNACPRSSWRISLAYDRPPAPGDKAGAECKPTGGEPGTLRGCGDPAAPLGPLDRRLPDSSHLLTAKLMKCLMNFSDSL